MTALRGPDGEEIERLQQTVARIERILSDITVNSDVANALATYLNTARLKLENLEEKEKAFEEEKTRRMDRELKVALVEREVALSHRERAHYGEFLEKEYFTKSDFGSLETFYANTWDRLTEGGQAEMSHRVWEGVRHKEYQFSELPDTVKEKEAQSLREMLAGTRRAPKELANIPSGDREDFIRTWDAGQKRESYRVLDRPSFAENVALSSSQVVDKDAKRQIGTEDAKVEAAERQKSEMPQETKTPKKNVGDADFSADELAGLDGVAKTPAQLATNTSKSPQKNGR